MSDATALWVLQPSGQRRSGEWIDDTLRQRAGERGLLGRWPEAGRFPRQRVEVFRGPHAEDAVRTAFDRRGWGDGLPLVPPTLSRVEALLAAGTQPAAAELGEAAPLMGLVTVEKVAVNAVMAGCTPLQFPVLLAAVEAVLDPAFYLRGVQTTDENVAPLVVVSAADAGRRGFNGDTGALGPGWTGNASVGRALRLVMQNLGGGWPGAVSLAGLGQPGRYSLCLAEHEAASPWPPLRVRLGHVPDAGYVVVQRAESAINVTGGLAELASVMGGSASAFSRLHGGIVAVALAPFVARRLADEGWQVADVQAWLHQKARQPVAEWEASWLKRGLAGAKQWPDWALQAARAGAVPAVAEPADITVFVAGADCAIPQCAYFPTWGYPDCRISRSF